MWAALLSHVLPATKDWNLWHHEQIFLPLRFFVSETKRLTSAHPITLNSPTKHIFCYLKTACFVHCIKLYLASISNQTNFRVIKQPQTCCSLELSDPKSPNPAAEQHHVYVSPLWFFSSQWPQFTVSGRSPAVKERTPPHTTLTALPRKASALLPPCGDAFTLMSLQPSLHREAHVGQLLNAVDTSE
jgi:hypothetical protein